MEGQNDTQRRAFQPLFPISEKTSQTFSSYLQIPRMYVLQLPSDVPTAHSIQDTNSCRNTHLSTTKSTLLPTAIFHFLLKEMSIPLSMGIFSTCPLNGIALVP